MVFVGAHKLDYVGALIPVDVEPTVTRLALVGAHHSRLGEALGAISARDDATIELSPQDRLDLVFETVPLESGQVRDLFLVSHGVYSSAPRPHASGGPGFGKLAALAPNQPNPFSRTTTIRFELPVSTRVKLEVFDLRGRRVAVLSEGVLPAGSHAVEWDRRDTRGKPLAPGVYAYRLTAGRFRAGVSTHPEQNI